MEKVTDIKYLLVAMIFTVHLKLQATAASFAYWTGREGPDHATFFFMQERFAVYGCCEQRLSSMP